MVYFCSGAVALSACLGIVEAVRAQDAVRATLGQAELDQLRARLAPGQWQHTACDIVQGASFSHAV